MKADGLILDLDGTLWNSCDSVAESWQNTVRKYDPQRVITTEDVRGVMGMMAWQIAQKLYSDFGDRALDICLETLREECAHVAEHGGIIFSGVEKTLDYFSRRCGVYIVSNCQEGYIEGFLQYSGFGKYIRDFLNPGITGLEKAGNIRQMIDRRRLQYPVYVGDTELDRQSAAEARCPFIHAAYGYGSVSEPCVKLDSFDELIGLLEPVAAERKDG